MLPSSYLGLPLGAPHKSTAVWDGVEERFWRRLAIWKRQYISKGGRLTLIRSTLTSVPLYYMSILHKSKGALSVRCLSTLNRALLGREGVGVGCWKEIKKEGSLLSNNIVFSVGNGRRVRFWKDSWCGDETLCYTFPSLFALAVSKEEWVPKVVLAEWLLMTIQGKRVSAE
ncbi:hypothetical protein CK203_041517 [Vitis vinifera]|uniref:Uncharacterized protein n=1 Tax=Vitis vinifera TaxID=29760 RepID=A0A438HNK5_VITVI|nr:hypothetical protein CK203_107557 [Vitis vinifera]RVW86017.1 hypothetical protein CK203_041517 [Vitis vinifera]